MQAYENDGIIFRPMTADDVDAVAKMEKICFRSPWSKRMLREELNNSVSYYHILEYEKEIIAYAGMWLLYNEAHITNVAVLPAHRRKGLGRRIMLLSMQAAAELKATEMTLEVRESNIGAQEMYKQLDFHYAGTRKRYYSDTGEDAFILWNRDIRETIKQLRG